MRERSYSGPWTWVTWCVLVICLIVPLCSGTGTQVQPVLNQIVIFSGQIPYGDGNVSIRSDSGVLYPVSAMTPVGIIQALAGTGMIDEYHIGDELLDKRGIFTLDGINTYLVSEEYAWFVIVNGVQLREYLLPSQEGLNTYLLKDGDDVLFAYGNPTLPASVAKALIWVQVGNKNGVMQLVSPSAIMGQYFIKQVPVSVPVPTEVPAVVVTLPSTPVPTEVPAVVVTLPSTPVPTEVPAVVVTLPSTPVPTEVPTVVVTLPSTPVPTEVPTVAATVPSTPVPTEVPTVVVTLPSTPVPTEVPTVAATVPSTPVPTEVPTVAATVPPTPEPEGVNITNGTETVPVTQKPEDNRMLYSGVYALPEGTLNITASSGMDYEIQVNTPIGLLHLLLKDALIKNLSIDDRGMRKGGILILEGINEYFTTATKVWFVKVNGNLLEDYSHPKTEGLNLYSLMAGDTISYYYGDPAGSLQDAGAMLFVTLG